MLAETYYPVIELTRGEAVESIHYGAIAVVNSNGELVAGYGNHKAVSYVRSTAKPLQALPFIEADGHTYFGLSMQEVALLCASHSGTDEHVAVLQSMHAKIGVSENDLLCGSHPPIHKPTAEMLLKRDETATPIRHNCSGKHSGMLAFARMLNLPTKDYINPEHPVQKKILETICQMADLQIEQIAKGTDGCSAPNFALPLYNTALALARLCDPRDLPPNRASACITLSTAMTTYPNMVAGPGRLDTRLMDVAQGRVISKGGAEGYLGMGIFPGVLGSDSPGLGIAIKISDGDPRGRARAIVALEILRQLGALGHEDLQALVEFGPTLQVKNWRNILVGEAKPCFKLKFKGNS